MVKPTQTLDPTWYKLLDEMYLTDDLWHLESADNVDNDTLEVVRVDKKLFFRDIIAVPEEIYLFANLSCATIVNPFKLTHGAFKT